jgi:hypothetical protein
LDVPEQYLRLVHNLSDREYDHGRMKHQLLSQAEIRSVQHYAVYDSLKPYVFIGGCSQGDGVLRCPAAGEMANVDLRVGLHADEERLDDEARGCVVRDDIWDSSLPAEKACCEHYLLNPENATSGANRSGAPADEPGASPVRWSPPPQGARARVVRAGDAGNRRDGAAGGESVREQEQGHSSQAAASNADGCMSGDTGRPGAAEPREHGQSQGLWAPLPLSSSSAAHTQDAGPAGPQAGDTDIFGHVSLVQSTAEAAGRTSRPGRRDSACLSTRRVQEGSESVRRDGQSSDKGAIKEKDQGLISRILHVFMRETPDSTYRSRVCALRWCGAFTLLRTSSTSINADQERDAGVW